MAGDIRTWWEINQLITELDNTGENPKDDPGDLLALYIGNDAVRGAYHRAQKRVTNNKKEGQ